jgi:hypothetical protein
MKCFNSEPNDQKTQWAIKFSWHRDISERNLQYISAWGSTYTQHRQHIWNLNWKNELQMAPTESYTEEWTAPTREKLG